MDGQFHVYYQVHIYFDFTKKPIKNNNKISFKKKTGNKCDQPPSDKKFKDNEFMDELCKASGFAGYFATSAKDNVNV